MAFFLPSNRGMAALIVASLALSGCAKKKEQALELTPVSGAVTLDGKPLAGADVAFLFDGVPPQGFVLSADSSDDQGHFELKCGAQLGAVPGTYKVTVSRLAGKDGKPIVIPEGLDIEQLRMQGEATESIPPRYSDQERTELRATVEKGKTDGYNFDLKSS